MISVVAFNFVQVFDAKSKGLVYDLSSLKTSSEDWTVNVGRKTFHLAVCKTLNPSSAQFLCPNTNSSACVVDNEVSHTQGLFLMFGAICENCTIFELNLNSKIKLKSKYQIKAAFNSHFRSTRLKAWELWSQRWDPNW